MDIVRSAIALTVCVSAVSTAQSIESRLDEYMKARERLGQFSGAVLVAQHGRILLAKGYGYADIELAVPNTRTTRFAVASITKQFTAFAIAQLRDSGKLRLSDSLSRFIDSCPPAWNGVTIDQLVHHTSGIPDYEADLDLGSQQYARYMMGANTARILADAKRKPLDFSAGTRFRYSNTGYLLLGRVIERVSGEPYATYVRTHILEPAKMSASGIIPSDRFVPQLATGYTGSDNVTSAQIAAGLPYLTGPYFRDTPVSIMADDHADGALYTTIDDLYAWDRALASASLASKSTLDEIFTPKLGGYGFGWNIGTRLGQPNQTHTGVLPGFVSRIDRFPANDLTVIVLSNVATSRFSQSSRDLASIVLGKPYDVPKARRLIARDSANEARFVGTYRLTEGVDAHVRPGRRFLEVEVPNQFTAGLQPQSATLFYAPFFEGDVSFSADSSGRVTSLTMHYNGEDHVAQRVP